MRQNRPSSLRGSVTQTNVSVRMRARERSGIGFLARLGILAAGALVVIGLCVAAWHAGWPQRQAEKLQRDGIDLTQKAQFAVRDISVEGRGRSSKDEIIDALGVQSGDPILSFDVKTAAARLEKLPWIGNATVERRLPDTIAVILTERTPAARWQHDDKLYVIDTDGHVLTSAKPDDFPDLPVVVGTGADHEAKNFLALLKNYPDIAEKTESSVRVGDRRWDLHLRPNITVRLPEDDIAGALRRLSVLMTQEKILDRDIVAIDLRFPGRVPIEPAAPPPKAGNNKAGAKKL